MPRLLTSMEYTLTTTILGKRKPPAHVGVIHLASSPELTQSDFEPSTSNLVTRRRYKCTHSGCDKAYTKPSRLEEHRRAHAGERPFLCETCQKSYLRETHLQAHVRSHLPESSRPLVCDLKGCQKRFWTSQHLRVHRDWHNGAKPFACPEMACHEAFSKHHQLRSHICEAHEPPGTKPYRCDHESCSKSFDTNQHLRTHKKTHNEKRYTCVNGSCWARSEELATFFPTWSALQHHIRSVHPPACLHPSCNGRVFASHKGLRSHQRLHEQRETEQQLLDSIPAVKADERPTKKPRRGGDIGRDWICDVEDCDKDFKSKGALNTHKNVTHLGRRDFACSQCHKAFGYKHLLQRHAAKIHAQVSSEHSDLADKDSDSDSDTFSKGHIDQITGKAYADRTSARVGRGVAFLCPFPELDGLGYDSTAPGATLPTLHCAYDFSRLYDLRRHLQSKHNIETSKEQLQSWIENRHSN